MSRQKRDMQFYNFWRSQYLARNQKCINLVKSIEMAERMATKIIKKDIDFILELDEISDGRIIHFLGTDVTTFFSEKELCMIKGAINDARHVNKLFGIDSCAFKDLFMDSVDVITKVINKEPLIPPLPYHFWGDDEYSGVILHDLSSPNSGMYINGFFEPDANALISICFDFPLEVINERIKMIKHEYENQPTCQQCFIHNGEKPIECINYGDSIASLHISSKPNVSFDTESATARAIGLWLWDYCKDNGCGSPTAIKGLRQTNYLEKLNYEKDDRHFRRLHERTQACVEAAEVLSLAKR